MKYIYLLLFVSSLIFHNCKGQNAAEDVEINGVLISQTILNDLKNSTGQNPTDFIKVNYHYIKNNESYTEMVDTIKNGFYFSKISEEKAKQLVLKYHDVCKANGNYIFLKELDFDNEWNSLYDLTIVKATNQFEVVKLMNTQGPSYDVTNEMVINKIKKWDKQVGLQLIVVQEDRIEAQIDKLPKDLEIFTNEIYELCPDVIDQGYGGMDEMIDDYQLNKYFWMWWD